jgi:radical SAM superfamily enzyme YgiQ (UPF0313 family)
MRFGTPQPSGLVLCRPGMASRAEQPWGRDLPLGLGYLAACARVKGLSVSVVDAKAKGHLSTDLTVSAIMEKRPRWVGISAMTFDFPLAAEIADKLKRQDQPPVVILGGPHASALPSESLAEAPGIDYVLAGQAEESLFELLARLEAGDSVEAVPGLYWRGPGLEVRQSARDPEPPDLESLPFPAWDLWPRQREYPLMTERGCPYACVFCCRNTGRTPRPRPVESVVEEVRWLKAQFDAKVINVEDDTLGLDPERTGDLLSRFAGCGLGRDIEFLGQTRPDRMTPELAGLMKAAGFRWVCFGVESGDDEVLRRSGKGITTAQVEAAVRASRAAGLKVWLKFILGLPGETAESAGRTIGLAVRLNPERFGAAVITAYPGTQVYAWALKGEQGYHLLSRDWRRFDRYLGASVELETLSARQLKRLQLKLVLSVYLRNNRLADLLRFACQDLPLKAAVLRSALFGR